MSSLRGGRRYHPWPLACHLLEELNREPGGIFRRLKTMRIRRERQVARE